MRLGTFPRLPWSDLLFLIAPLRCVNKQATLSVYLDTRATLKYLASQAIQLNDRSGRIVLAPSSRTCCRTSHWECSPSRSLKLSRYLSINLSHQHQHQPSIIQSRSSSPSDSINSIQATSPIFAVALSRVFLGELFTTKILLSLIPIIGGVTLCTLTEINFDALGFTSAVIATLAFVGQSIYSKVRHTTIDSIGFNSRRC